MKSPSTENETAGRKLGQRLAAFIRPARKKTHRLSANVTGEEDWEVDEPQIRMSRAFAVMLVLHLVAVGGLFAFHVFGKDDREAEIAATGKAHETSPPPPAVAVSKSSAPAPGLTVSAPVPPRAEIVPENPSAVPAEPKHVFKAGETKMLIAAKFGVTVRELEEANPVIAFHAGDTLVIPRHQRVIGAIADNKPSGNPALALIVATQSDDVAHREFALKQGADDPYAPVEPASLSATTPERASARSTPVKAEPQHTLVKSQDDSGEPDESPEPVAAAPKVKKPTPPAVLAKPKPVSTGSRTHVVGKGDTVYNVARRYGLSPNEILRANGIADPSRLQMGQVLKISVRR